MPDSVDKVMDKMRVPLSFGWLSENGLLKKAARVKSSVIHEVKPDYVSLILPSGSLMARWDDNWLFTLDELEAIGFENRYCPSCHKPLAICEEEKNDIAERR